MKYDKDEIKNSLTIEQVADLIAELGGEPIMFNNWFTAKTICHGGESHKLYYYENTKLFRCYTECDDTFDIFDLVTKVKKRELNKKWEMINSVIFVASYFKISGYKNDDSFDNFTKELSDWEFLNRYNKNLLEEEEKKIELKCYDDSILKFLPRPRIESWEKEGIKHDIILSRGICYDPKNQGVVIPHYDINGNLIGIRERTLIKDLEQYGKYRPAILNNQMYNHPLGFNLYNLNNSKDAIKILKKVVVFEGEKSPLLYASYFGEDNDISCATCGSSLISHQANLLLSLGVEEIIIGYDKQFKEIGDDEWRHWTKKLTGFYHKYSGMAKISFLFDKENLLNYKDSPIDQGLDTYMYLFKNRITL